MINQKYPAVCPKSAGGTECEFVLATHTYTNKKGDLCFGFKVGCANCNGRLAFEASAVQISIGDPCGLPVHVIRINDDGHTVVLDLTPR